MKARLRNQVAALMLLAPLGATLVAGPAAAQQRTAAPQIQGMSLNADNGLEPGSDLRVSVQGTPGSRAIVNFGRTPINLALREQARGVYTGTYTVRRADRIDPTSVINVRLTRSGITTRHAFTYPPSFQAVAMGAAPANPPAPAFAPAPAPRIERFATLPAGRLEPGRELRYRVNGLPGANVQLDIPGVVQDIPMREVSPGVYEASYTIRQRDDIDAFGTAVATLRSGERWVTSRLDRAFPRERDNRAPTISRLTPEQGDVVSPQGNVLVSGAFDDGNGPGVDPRSVRLLVGGRDVTAAASITPERFSYRGDLSPGHYAAEVTARDHAGNIVSKSWSFDVGAPRVGVAPGSLPLHVSNPANNTWIDGNGRVQLDGRTAPWASVRIQVDAVPPVVGQLLGVSQNVFNETVRADRDGFFHVSIDPRGPVIPGARYDVTLSATRGDQTAESRLTLRQRG